MSPCCQVSSLRTPMSCWLCKFSSRTWICFGHCLIGGYGTWSKSRSNLDPNLDQMANTKQNMPLADSNHLWSLISTAPLNPQHYKSIGGYIQNKSYLIFLSRCSLYLGNECTCSSWQWRSCLSFSAGAQLICWGQTFDFVLIGWILWLSLQLLVCTPIPSLG